MHRYATCLSCLINLQQQYTVSPPVADYIRGNETLRSVIRTGLKPLVQLSRQLVSTDTLAAQK